MNENTHPGHGKTALCAWCRREITDGCEVSGYDGTDEYDWMTLDGDFGCDSHPASSEDQTGPHQTAQEVRAIVKAACL